MAVRYQLQRAESDVRAVGQVVTRLMAGSISLVGGVGTALAWAPTFVDDLGIPNALEIGIACNTVGLIAACCIGGPIAAYLVKRHGLGGGG